MKHWLLLLLALATPATAGSIPDKHPLMSAYVARIISARELPTGPCPDENECWAYSAGYELELEIVQPILGDAKRGLRKATINLRHGFPEFGHYEHAFVFEFAEPQGGVLGDGYPVAKSTNGPWAFCADGDHWEALQGRHVRFVAPVRLNEATRNIGNSFLREAGMPEGKRLCHHGIWAEELATAYADSARPALPLFVNYQLKEK